MTELNMIRVVELVLGDIIQLPQRKGFNKRVEHIQWQQTPGEWVLKLTSLPGNEQHEERLKRHAEVLLIRRVGQPYTQVSRDILASDVREKDVLLIEDEELEVLNKRWKRKTEQTGCCWEISFKDSEFVLYVDLHAKLRLVSRTEVPAVPEAENSVNHPSHYGGDTVYETIKVIEAWDLGFCLGNAVKYISRAGKKDAEKELEDLKKAEFYLRRHIEQLENDPR